MELKVRVTATLVGWGSGGRNPVGDLWGRSVAFSLGKLIELCSWESSPFFIVKKFTRNSVAINN